MYSTAHRNVTVYELSNSHDGKIHSINSGRVADVDIGVKPSSDGAAEISCLINVLQQYKTILTFFGVGL